MYEIWGILVHHQMFSINSYFGIDIFIKRNSFCSYSSDPSCIFVSLIHPVETIIIYVNYR